MHFSHTTGKSDAMMNFLGHLLDFFAMKTSPPRLQRFLYTRGGAV